MPGPPTFQELKAMPHFYRDVKGLGHVAVSRHAQDRMKAEGISFKMFEAALHDGVTTPDGLAVLWREKDGVRAVIVKRPEPFNGAMLVTTVYRPTL